MAIRIVAAEETPWIGLPPPRVDTGPVLDDRGRVELPDWYIGDGIRYIHPGGEKNLQLIEVRRPPNYLVPSHGHESDEIMYVLEGEMHMGSRVLLPGTSIHIDAYTPYGFRAGPDGLRFFVFRAQREDTTIEMKDLLATKRSRREAAKASPSGPKATRTKASAATPA